MEQNLLSHYGDCIATYSGEGTLTLPNNQTAKCSFEAGQLKNRTVVLLCDFSPPPPYFPIAYAQSFEGETDEGFRISTVGPIVGMNDLTNQRINLLDPHIRLAFFVSEMTFQKIVEKPVKSVRFGITNFILDKPLSLCLQEPASTTALSIAPLHDYERIMRRVQTLRAIDVTCEVSIALSENDDIKALQGMVSNLCYLLSIVQGIKVNWVYCYQYDETGTLVIKQHDSRITKIFSPLSLIEGKTEIKAFLEGTYSSFVAKGEEKYLVQDLIDAYLDAKAEADHLQVRGVKLAVVMEMLKYTFLKIPEVVKGGEFILPKTTFRAFRRLIESPLRYVLSILGVDPDEQDALFKKLGDLNRKSFKTVLEAIFNYIGLDLPGKDVDTFVKCRNKLVHTGHFYSETASEQELESVSFESTGRVEYYFLVNVLDKVFLRLLGYRGSYVERRIQDQVMHQQVLTL